MAWAIAPFPVPVSPPRHSNLKPEARPADNCLGSTTRYSGQRRSFVLNPLFRRLRSDMRSRVRDALDAGVGLYNRSWDLAGWAARERAGEALASEVLDWCKETAASMRKPYGLDYMTLAISVIGPENGEIATANFGVLRPEDFYGDGVAEREVGEIVRRWESEGLLGSPQSRRLAVVLFSWGDLTRDLLLAG